MRKAKLVRNKIPEEIIKQGRRPKVRRAIDSELMHLLKEKLKEEVHEFVEVPGEEEFADIFEVLYAIAEFRKWKMEEIEKIRKKKAEHKGDFSERIILEGVE